MALAVNISVLGDRALERKLSRLKAATQKKIVRKALRAAAKPIRDDAKANAPVDEGDLRKNIKVRAMRRSRVRLGVIVRTGTRDEMGIPADSNWYYPAIVEYGYDDVPANPYLRNALDKNRQQALRTMGAEISSGIDREARR